MMAIGFSKEEGKKQEDFIGRDTMINNNKYQYQYFPNVTADSTSMYFFYLKTNTQVFNIFNIFGMGVIYDDYTYMGYKKVYSSNESTDLRIENLKQLSKEDIVLYNTIIQQFKNKF